LFNSIRDYIPFTHTAVRYHDFTDFHLFFLASRCCDPETAYDEHALSLNRPNGFLRINRSEIESPEQLWTSQPCTSTSNHVNAYFDKDLVQLNKRHTVTQTLKSPSTKYQVYGLLSLLDLLRRGVEPPFRPEHVRVFTEDLFVSHHPKNSGANLRSGWDEVTIYHITARRDQFTLETNDRRPDPETLFDNCLQVREVPRFCVCDWGGNRGFGVFSSEL
jgi:hypothetical protein